MALFKKKEPKALDAQARQAEIATARLYRPCPTCGKDVPRDERVCPHCLHESPAWTQHEDGRWWAEVDGVWNVLDEESGTWAIADDQLLPNELWAGAGKDEEQARAEERDA
jgi:endogenous inhibitor of DNA gyrase (YacG/DUF329 family)